MSMAEPADKGNFAESLHDFKETLECFAKPERALQITGYVVGSMPPFGHLVSLPTYLDESVLQMHTVYGGGGDLDTMLEVQSQEVLSLSGAVILDLKKL